MFYNCLINKFFAFFGNFLLSLTTFACLTAYNRLPTFALNNITIMVLSLKEHNMTISMEFKETTDKEITPEEVLLGAYDILSRVFSQEQVSRAYKNTDPDTMSLRTGRGD